MPTYNIVNVSGGKDSAATLLKAIEDDVENMIAVSADTGHEHPYTYEHLDYLEYKTGVKILRVKADFTEDLRRKKEKVIPEKWRREGVSEEIIRQALANLEPTGIPFLDMVRWKGQFPSKVKRFCSICLKAEPIADHVYTPFLMQGGYIISWQGVRREESAARASLSEREQQSDHIEIYRPIIDLKHEEVFAIHNRHGIEPNPLYKLGCGRVGCMPCIYSRKNELFNIANRFPEEIERVRGWEKAVALVSRKGEANFFSRLERGNNIYEAVEWSKTDRGGRQFDLIKMLESMEPSSCSSQYGLCE